MLFRPCFSRGAENMEFPARKQKNKQNNKQNNWGMQQ